jgi:two-component system nitrate/nitrite response regulator NarL
MSKKTRIVIVDDYPLFREGVAELLSSAPDTQVVGLGGTADEAAGLAADLQPDLLLLDLDMPGGGLNAARAVACCCPTVKIVILTVSRDEDDLSEALQAGARAYVLKGISGRKLTSILRSVQAGQRYLSPALVSRDTASTAGIADSSSAPASDPGDSRNPAT